MQTGKNFVEMVEVLNVERDNSLEVTSERIDVDAADVGITAASNCVRDVVEHSGSILAGNTNRCKIMAVLVGCPGEIDYPRLQ